MNALLSVALGLTVGLVVQTAYMLFHMVTAKPPPELVTVVEMLDNRPDEWRENTWGLSGPLGITVDARYSWRLDVTRNGVPITAADSNNRQVRDAVERWHTRRRRIAADRLLTDMTTDDQRRIMQARQAELNREMQDIQRRLASPPDA